MRWFVRFVLVFACCGAALAADRAAERRALLDALKNAPSEAVGRAVEGHVWRHWMVGPTQEATALVATAMTQRRKGDFAGALETLDEAVKLAPEWSEAWNQRAFVHFLRDSFDKSLEDLDRALELEPKHFGAMSGKVRILMRQGRDHLGQKVLREALKIHPWLKERHMLIEPAGDDL